MNDDVDTTEALTRIAEHATAGVKHHMRCREELIAAALQGFAATAWGAAHGDVDTVELVADAERAHGLLLHVSGADTPRRFLRDAVARVRALHTSRHPPPFGFVTLDELDHLVRDRGIQSVRAGALRDAVGGRRLDAATRALLEVELDRRDLGVLPAGIPPDARRWVRVYSHHHPAGLLVAALGLPGPDGDRLARAALAAHAHLEGDPDRPRRP
ncbi:MAG: hypothetical protein KDC33_11295 [Thermoleophilia bacterium]|nr:hypothetical protein [Thermoleophilia bacterium]